MAESWRQGWALDTGSWQCMQASNLEWKSSCLSLMLVHIVTMEVCTSLGKWAYAEEKLKDRKSQSSLLKLKLYYFSPLYTLICWSGEIFPTCCDCKWITWDPQNSLIISDSEEWWQCLGIKITHTHIHTLLAVNFSSNSMKFGPIYKSVFSTLSYLRILLNIALER